MKELISGIIQIIFLILKNKFEKDAELKKQKEDLHAEASNAIKARDLSRINSVIVELRK